MPTPALFFARLLVRNDLSPSPAHLPRIFRAGHPSPAPSPADARCNNNNNNNNARDNGMHIRFLRSVDPTLHYHSLLPWLSIMLIIS